MKDFGKAVRAKLSGAGCAFLRRGKGDHDVWTTAAGKRLIAPFRSSLATPQTAS